MSHEAGPWWRARGDIIDLRKHGFVPSNYDLQPSGVIHFMTIDLAIDPETLRIARIEVDQPFVAIEATAATGGECCRDPAPRLLELRGETLDEGFAKRLGAHFGGTLGCSHLLTLFQLMASTIPRAVDLELNRIEREGTEHEIGERFFRRGVFVDGHERSPDTLDVALQLTDAQSRPIALDTPASERLELCHEVKLIAGVDRKRFQIERLDAMERRRNRASLARLDWEVHDERLASLVGAPMIPGLAARLFGLLGGDPDARPLLDASLQLAPGFIQIVAALMDSHFAERAAQPTGSRALAPTVSSIGGTTNSCYMWRADSAVTRAREAVADRRPSRVRQSRP
jgi:hypothetical protein